MDVVFVFPYRNEGGVPHLFSRCAEKLAQEQNYRVSVLDYKDGSLAALLTGTDVNHILYNDDAFAQLPSNAVIIFQLMTPWSIFQNISYGKGSRILFWSCHPFNIVPTLPPVRKLMSGNRFIAKCMYATILWPFYKSCIKFLSLIEKNDAIIFMDIENADNISYFLGYKVSAPKIVPLCSKITATPHTFLKLNDNVIHFVWIGRLVDFKYFALEKFIIDLEAYCISHSRNAKLTIIGDGEYSVKLRTLCKKILNIEVVFLAEIVLTDLHSYVSECHCAIAMGTSAIDCASLGVPTIVLDFDYKKFPSNYHYKFIHEQLGATLGRSLSRSRADGRALEHIIENITRDHNLLGEEAYRYVQKVHNLDTTVGELKIAIESTTLCYSKILPQSFFIKQVYDIFKVIRGKLSV